MENYDSTGWDLDTCKQKIEELKDGIEAYKERNQRLEILIPAMKIELKRYKDRLEEFENGKRMAECKKET
jgi:hypothetical protein